MAASVKRSRPRFGQNFTAEPSSYGPLLINRTVSKVPPIAPSHHPTTCPQPTQTQTRRGQPRILSDSGFIGYVPIFDERENVNTSHERSDSFFWNVKNPPVVSSPQQATDANSPTRENESQAGSHPDLAQPSDSTAKDVRDGTQDHGLERSTSSGRPQDERNDKSRENSASESIIKEGSARDTQKSTSEPSKTPEAAPAFPMPVHHSLTAPPSFHPNMLGSAYPQRPASQLSTNAHMSRYPGSSENRPTPSLFNIGGGGAPPMQRGLTNPPSPSTWLTSQDIEPDMQRFDSMLQAVQDLAVCKELFDSMTTQLDQ